MLEKLSSRKLHSELDVYESIIKSHCLNITFETDGVEEKGKNDFWRTLARSKTEL